MIIKLIDGKYMVRGGQIIRLKESDREENRRAKLNLIDLNILNKGTVEYGRAKRYNTVIRAGFSCYNEYQRYRRIKKHKSNITKIEFLEIEEKARKEKENLPLIDLSQLKYKSKEYNKANKINTAIKFGFKDYNQLTRYKKHIKKNPNTTKEEFLNIDLEREILNKKKENFLSDLEIGSWEREKARKDFNASILGFKDHKQHMRYNRKKKIIPDITIKEFLETENAKELKERNLSLIDVSQFKHKSTEYNKAINNNVAIRQGFRDYRQYKRYRYHVKMNPNTTPEEFVELENSNE